MINVIFPDFPVDLGGLGGLVVGLGTLFKMTAKYIIEEIIGTDPSIPVI